ncbi:MAG: cation:proton antiporter, partial [Bacteroidetes bacterium]|nr:cation:proton antiporter [Bacteroidota bacterium]
MEFDFLNLFSVLFAAWLAGWLASRLGYPSVLGGLVAGVLLGPPLLGLLHGSEALYVLAELGLLLMMLYIGMEIDPRELTKASWAGLLAAIAGFFVPFGLGYFAATGLGSSHPVGLVVGISAGATSLAVNSRILLDLRILDTRISHVMMAGALIANILSLLVFSVVLGIVEIGEFELMGVATMLGKAVLFFSVTVFVGQKVFPYIGRLMTRSGLTGRPFHFTLVLILAVLFGELAQIAGLHAIVGAFIAGLFLRENVLGRSLASDLRNAVQDTSIGLLTPIFFVTAGFEVSLGIFEGQLGLFVLIVAAAVLGKTLGTALFYVPLARNWREGLVIGAGMNGRGGVDIVIIAIALKMGILSQSVFSILVFMALLTTAVVPVVLKHGIAWLRRSGELVQTREKRTGTVIVGAGPLARSLARLLNRTEPVTLVDSNKHYCVVSKSEGLKTICGSALQEQILREADAERAERLIAMTPTIEINTLASRLPPAVFGGVGSDTVE